MGATIAVSGGGIALGTSLTREPAAAAPEHARPAASNAGSAARATRGPLTPGESPGAGRPDEPRRQAPSTTAVSSSEVTPSAAGTPGRSPAPNGANDAGAQPVAGLRAEETAAPAPKLETPSLDAPSPTVPALPPVALPSTGEVAATDPVVAIANETLDSAALPPLPAAELPKVELPKAEMPKIDAPEPASPAPLPVPQTAPALPTEPTVLPLP